MGGRGIITAMTDRWADKQKKKKKKKHGGGGGASAATGSE